MSNPAPTLNQINAFNATQGTTIDFNIIGGTEVIRSNKIYIYDLSDNSLICTHLYVSTESIHELPPNTSSSIVYASGKSSADFTNNTQYYAQIQTFTDVGGTQGGSGLSIAKLFWCLPTPTLTLSTIPTTISTTSYNVSATYTPNTSGGATNEIQEFQFNLYSAIGALLQTSGVVLYGEGVDLSYNFSGLEVDSTYYVTLDVTTTQGMNVSAQSNTFTVSIDTPTMGSASVVNNGCDGYISVTSNLSSEYKHEESVDSGDIMSFTTESLNDVVKLVVDIDPVQDLHGYDKPWVGGGGKNILPFDEALTNGWTNTLNGVTATYNNGVMHIQGTHTNSGWSNVVALSPWNSNPIPIKNGETIAVANTPQYTSNLTIQCNVVGNLTNGSVVPSTGDITCHSFYIAVQGLHDFNFDVPMIVTYGNTRPTTYEPYSNICPITGWTGCEVDVSGKNLFDGTLQNGYWDTSNGTFVASSGWRATNKIRCKPNTTYVMSGTSYSSGSYNGSVVFWDSNGTYLGYRGTGANFTSYPNSEYMALYLGVSYITDSMQIEEGSSASAYEPYTGTTYPITWQTEAGTVYGGTVDLVSGVLTVDRAYAPMPTDWQHNSLNNNVLYVHTYAFTDLPIVTNADTQKRVISDALNGLTANEVVGAGDVGSIAVVSNKRLMAKVSADMIPDVNAFNQWVTDNNFHVCYELATPTTYQLTPTQIHALLGQNNVWSNTNGGMSLVYQLPITSLLVKRRDVADVSGKWLTLYSVPITQASDMDFTFIDFLNQYGKKYQYALVPVLAQNQSGVIVQIEGGYTVSDNVDSIFDGVYIADQTNVERVKAGVGYGNIDMNQGVGSITPIGSKYPIVITNSQNQYHNGSIRGTIVPNDFYSNGNLSRIDMVNKRDELEQFLTNKRAKIIKDWNGKMWLVMIMSNVNCSFDDNYGMGMVSFSADWLEVGDPTNQQDLYNAGLINVGGV